jgi:RpiR family transcriptional regulator, carbohydrate utilization regulator
MLDRIQASLSSLSASEQRVAQLVLSNPGQFAKLPVVELALQAKVSKPTVVRFCRSMGYEGLTDFKLKLAGTVSEGVPYIHRSVGEDDKLPDVAVKVVDNAVATFLKFRNELSTQGLAQAADALARAYTAQRRIEFYGVGNSGIVAQDAQHKFFRLGVTALAYSDGHMQVMGAALLRAGDVLVIISNSGRTRDLLDAADIAKKHGATTIAITRSHSPLALVCDIHLSADPSERYHEDIPMTSRLVHLLIIDILATALALRIGSATLRPMLQEIKSNLQRKRYS